MDNEKVYRMKFSSVYPLLVNKAVRKAARRKKWMKSFPGSPVMTGMRSKHFPSRIWITLLFSEGAELNPRRELIKGVICGIRVEEIEEPLMKEIRYLDKLVDELAKGKAMDKILRG